MTLDLSSRVLFGGGQMNNKSISHTNKTTLYGLVFVVLLVSCVGSVSAAAVLNSANGHYYELVNDPYITWDDAKDAAEADSPSGSLCPGHLATITSIDENNFVSNQYSTSLHHKWLGGYQAPGSESTPSDNWQWVTGETWSYFNWNSGEPNNVYYQAWGYESALTYWWSSTSVWNDAPPSYPYSDGGYLVEWECTQILIDIKPGSYPNSINAGEQGTVPVAILGSEDFDVTTIDAATITFGDAAIDTRGSVKAPKLAFSFEDVNSDGFMDLVAHFSVEALGLDGLETELSLTAKLSNGADIIGSDSVNIVPA
jgi:hypothetical protein